MFCELGQSLIAETVLALNQNAVQPLISFNAARFVWLESSAEGKMPRDERR